MPFGIVADRTEFFIELYRGRIPFQDLKVDALKAPLFCELRDDSNHRLPETVAPIVVGDKNILEVISALAAKTGEIRIEHCVGHRLLSMKRDEPLRSEERRVGKECRERWEAGR